MLAWDGWIVGQGFFQAIKFLLSHLLFSVCIPVLISFFFLLFPLDVRRDLSCNLSFTSLDNRSL